jgi:lipopolysaccharide cholinephosphotransferase
MKRTADYLNEIAKTEKVFYQISDIESNALKKCLLSMYQDILYVCDKYNLCIMLGGGSVLGAVRHQGFIPWDDDLDAMMPRKDYKVLIKIFDKELSDKYYISVPQYSEESEGLFMHIIKKNTLLQNYTHMKDENTGVRIDIYPIENAPNNKLLRISMALISDFFRILILSRIFYVSRSNLFKELFLKSRKSKFYYHLRYLIGMFMSLYSKKCLYDNYDKFVSCSKGNKFCAIPTGRKMFHNEIYKRDVFFPTKKMKFENLMVEIPNKADDYLRILYGNYMLIPPPEERERHFYVNLSIDTTNNNNNNL